MTRNIPLTYGITFLNSECFANHPENNPSIIIGDTSVPIPKTKPINAPVIADCDAAASPSSAINGGQGPNPYIIPEVSAIVFPVIFNLVLAMHFPCKLKNMNIPRITKNSPSSCLDTKKFICLPSNPAKNPSIVYPITLPTPNSKLCTTPCILFFAVDINRGTTNGAHDSVQGPTP